MNFDSFEDPVPYTTASPREAFLHRVAFINVQINPVLAENLLPLLRLGGLTAFALVRDGTLFCDEKVNYSWVAMTWTLDKCK